MEKLLKSKKTIYALAERNNGLQFLKVCDSKITLLFGNLKLTQNNKKIDDINIIEISKILGPLFLTARKILLDRYKNINTDNYLLEDDMKSTIKGHKLSKIYLLENEYPLTEDDNLNFFCTFASILKTIELTLKSFDEKKDKLIEFKKLIEEERRQIDKIRKENEEFMYIPWIDD